MEYIFNDRPHLYMWSHCVPQCPPLCLRLAASLRAELNHLHATAIEHIKQIHLKENSVAKRELEKAMEHSHQQVTVTVSSFSSGVRVSRATDCFLSHFLSMSSFSRNKSSWSACPTCSRRCVPVATASPTWTTRSTLWTRPSTLWPESWSWRAKRFWGSAARPTIRLGTSRSKLHIHRMGNIPIHCYYYRWCRTKLWLNSNWPRCRKLILIWLTSCGNNHLNI